MNRNESLTRLETETFDLCVIGGGASGAGCALDAALRGLKVALVEKTDFAAETSSKSTKLIHGGVRYLEQAFRNFDFGQLRQVRHGLEERHIVLANAPHLAHPLALVTPVFSWFEGLYFRIGLWLYDRFASGMDTLPNSRWLTKKEALRLLPGLTKRMHSAVLYYDGQLDDARYCLALVQRAAGAGATVVNHAEVVGFEKDTDGNLEAASLRDRLSGSVEIKVRAKLFLNCTGPFADQIRLMANPGVSPRIRPSKGVHLLLPESALGAADAALLIPKTPDGRVVFAIPFQGAVLLGTTDRDYPDTEQEPVLEASELDFLLETLAPYLEQNAVKSQVKAGFGGLRPLLMARGKQTKGLVRDHEVEHDPDTQLYSLLGGKWTTYRLMARDAVDAICAHLGNSTACTTEAQRLAGGEGFRPDAWKIVQDQFNLPEDVARHLCRNYGSQVSALPALFSENPDWKERLVAGYPFIRAEVVYAVRAEMACTPRDVLARRIRLEILDWAATLEAIPVTVSLMAAELNWSEAERKTQEDAYRRIIQGFREKAKG